MAFIQAAGQAIDSASAALSETVRSEAEDMLSRVAASPFGSASAQALERFRLAARLGQELLAMEQQLRQIHAAASELADAPAVGGLPTRSKAEGPPLPKAPPRDLPGRTAAKQRKKSRPAAGQVQSDNDVKLRQYLETALRKGEWTRLHGRAVTQGSGLPTGSVGASMRRLLASGAVQKGARGMYKLVA